MKKTNKFDQRLSTIPTSAWSKIAKIDELKGQWIAGAKLSPQALGRLKKSVLITSTGSSTRIEGSKLSDEEVERLMRGMSTKKWINRDKQEVKGYYELLKNVFDSWEQLRLSENSIKHFHKELLKYGEKDERHRGDYKKGENRVEMLDENGKSLGIVFNTTPAYLTPKEMQETVEWTEQAFSEKTHHPLLIIGSFIIEFLQIHPFQDGNGRLSRILTNLLLLKEGYHYVPYISHEKLIEDNKTDYYLALRKSQRTFKTKHEDITPWLDFFLSMVLEQSKMAVGLLSEENIEKILSQKQRAVWEYIQTVKDASPGEIAEKTKVVRATVSQAIDKLLRLKKIERIGLGRSTRYRKL